MLRVTLLGSGGSAGVPMIGGADGRGDWGACDAAEPRNRRLRASILIEGEGGARVLVDTSPDLRAQMLENAIARIDAIVFTHAHADHITGLDDVRILNRLVGSPLPAFATEATLAELRQRFDYAFKPWKPPGFFRPVFAAQVIEPGTVFTAGGLALSGFAQDHGFIPTLGLRVGRFAYSTDVVRLDAAAMASLAGVDTWVVGCFLRKGPHPTHAHIDLVVSWARALGVRRTVLTHMGTDMDWGWLRANLPAGIEPGYDGQRLEIAG